MALGEQAEQQPLQSTQEQAHNQLKSFVLGQPGRAPRQPRGGREGGVCSPTSCSQPSRSSWDSRGGRRVSQGAGARAGSAALHPAANQVVRPGTAGAGAASAKGRARGALMGGSPVSPVIKPFVLGQPGRAPPATGLVMQGLRHPSQPTKSSVPGTAGAGAASHGAGDAGSAASIAANQVVSSWDSRGGRRQPRGGREQGCSSCVLNAANHTVTRETGYRAEQQGAAQTEGRTGGRTV